MLVRKRTLGVNLGPLWVTLWLLLMVMGDTITCAFDHRNRKNGGRE